MTPCEGRLQRQFEEFLSNGGVLSRIRSDIFRIATFYEKLLLHSKYFCRAVSSPEKLVQHNSYFFGAATSSEQLLFLSSYFFRTLTSSQQLFFQNGYLFEAKLLPTSYLLKWDSSLGQRVLQNSYYSGRQICSEYWYLQKSGFSRIAAFSSYFLKIGTFFLNS